MEQTILNNQPVCVQRTGRQLTTIYDVIIVGSGAGGATLARELSKNKKKVLLVEKGANHRWIGSHIPALFFVDKAGFLYSEEGLNVIRGITTGGSTLIFSGTAAPPPPWLSEKYGIELAVEVEDTEKELNIKPLPKDKLGKASIQVMEAAGEIGYHWEPLPKFINPDKCINGCSKCMIGCSTGAKWTAREYIKESLQNGADLLTHTEVKEVLIDKGKAVGIIACKGGSTKIYYSNIVIVSAGGLGTPPILQRSGIWEAGQGFFCDPTVLVYGIIKGKGTNYCPPMTVGTYEHQAEDGIMLSHLMDTKVTFPLQIYKKGINHLLKCLKYGNLVGIMIKVKDDLDGRVNIDGTFTKPLSYQDRLKIDKGIRISEKILIKAGAFPDSIVASPVRGTHPGGTARIGEVVDNNLETKIKNLYVCDASVYPESLDRPVVLTTIALAKKLARYLFR